jgi:hypothetical protein
MSITRAYGPNYFWPLLSNCKSPFTARKCEIFRRVSLLIDLTSPVSRRPSPTLDSELCPWMGKMVMVYAPMSKLTAELNRETVSPSFSLHLRVWQRCPQSHQRGGWPALISQVFSGQEMSRLSAIWPMHRCTFSEWPSPSRTGLLLLAVIGRYTKNTHPGHPTPKIYFQDLLLRSPGPRKKQRCHNCLFEGILKDLWPPSNDDPSASASQSGERLLFRPVGAWGWLVRPTHMRTSPGGPDWLRSFQGDKVAYTKLAMVINYRQEGGSVD